MNVNDGRFSMIIGDKSHGSDLLRVFLCAVIAVALCSCQTAAPRSLLGPPGSPGQVGQAADLPVDSAATRAAPQTTPAAGAAQSAMNTAVQTDSVSGWKPPVESISQLTPAAMAADAVSHVSASATKLTSDGASPSVGADVGGVRLASHEPVVSATDAGLAVPCEGVVMMPPAYATGPACAAYPSGCGQTCSAPCGPACMPSQAWSGPGRWPHSEYLCDGGDRNAEVDVMPDWTVRGLDQEDTVVHFDTLDGKTEVEPANRVCVYAPRFAAVRQVSGLMTHETHDRVAGVELPVSPILHEDLDLVTTVNQPLQPERYLGSDGPQLFQEDVRGAAVVTDEGLVGLANRLRPYEDLQLIRDGIFDSSQKARLSVSMDAALAWTDNQAVQVAIDNVTAVVANNDTALQSVYRYDLPPGKPRVRIVKLASTKHAQPGDTVEFTIRFDNVGDQAVGNVTIVDNLATRLEYVPESQECSLEADFVTQDNTGESLVLRWEVREPMDVGEGGVIRFTCRVR